MLKIKHIQVFEYGKLHVGHSYGSEKIIFNQKHFDALTKFNELHNGRYFQVGYKNITCKQYVGVIQVDGLCVEILPKADKTSGNENLWQGVLIEMLKTTHKLKVYKVGNAEVNKQNIHLLDIYFEWFLNELQIIIRSGLLRKYYRKQGNLSVLKGKLIFDKQISQNRTHRERFYTEYQIYDYDHLIHQILQQALTIITHISKGNYLYNRCKIVALNFPEVKKIMATKDVFEKIPKNRKTKQYETVINIARLIILNYAPNITKGSENMFALLFNMNSLWEQYVAIKLGQAYREDNCKVLSQRTEIFWNNRRIKPDIVIKDKEDKTICIIDAKWKNLWNEKPSVNDLKQMYLYNEYWQSKTSLLLYPTNKNRGQVVEKFQDKDHSCGLTWVNVLKNGKLNDTVGYEVKYIVEALK